jgi:hypothetical protein
MAESDFSYWRELEPGEELVFDRPDQNSYRIEVRKFNHIGIRGYFAAERYISKTEMKVMVSSAVPHIIQELLTTVRSKAKGDFTAQQFIEK